MDLKSTIEKRYETAQTNQSNKFKLFNAIDDVLNQKAKDLTNNAKLGSPYAWAAVETVVPRLVAKDPNIEYQPREESDQDKSQNASDLFKYWAQKVNLFNYLTEWAKVSASYGTGVLKLIWKTDTRDIKKFVYDEFGMPVIDEMTGEYATQTETITVFDDPHPEIVSNNYIFYSPGATSPRNANWVIHRYWKTLDELKKENEHSKIYKDLNQIGNYKGKDHSPEEKKRHESFGYGNEENDDTVKIVEILEMWDRETGRQSMLANGETIIMDREFPYWHGQLPFIKLVDSIVPYEWFGKGEVEPIIKDIYVIDTLTNQRLDELTGILKKWKIKGEVDEEELYEPDLPIHVSDMDDAELVNFPNATADNLNEVKTREASIQNTLGIQDYTANADTQADRTAQGMTIKAEQLNARFNHKTQLFEAALKELGDMVLALYQQFLTSERAIRIIGDTGVEFKNITPQDIAGEFDCIPEAGSTQPVDRNMEKQESLNAKTIFQGSPFVKQDELEKKTLEKFFPKDFQTIMQDPMEIKNQQLSELMQTPQVQELIQNMAAQMAQEMTGGQQMQVDERTNQIHDRLLDHNMKMEQIQAQNEPKMMMRQ